MDLQQIIQEVLDHIRGMWRYRWHMVCVAWTFALIGWVMVYRMPDVFEASARVSVDTNSLLPSLTQGLTANESVLDEVSLVSRALLTRPNLAEVARHTDLDLRAKTPQDFELLISGLQERISVKGGRDNVFDISFEDTSRQKATEVVSALLSTFVETSLTAQGDDAEMSERALQIEIDDHESRLLKAEADLADFKKRNLGYMPEDGGDYYTRLQTATGLVADIDQKIRLLRQRRNEIARQLEGEEPVFGIMPTTPAQVAAACSKSGNIAQLESQLSSLQVDFTDRHPRIVMLKETIAALQAECDAERAQGGGTVPLVDPETNSLNSNMVYQNLRLQLSEADVELAGLTEELSSRQRAVYRLREDVDKIAEVETELKKLNRDYGVVEQRHQELLRRWETLQSRKRLEPVTDRVQFNILEPPFAMAEPIAPNRPFLLSAILVVALGAGSALAFGMNQLKPVFYSRRTLSRVAGVPVLGSVSLLVSPSVAAARRRKSLIWVAANVLLLMTGILAIVLADPLVSIIKELTQGVV